MEYGRKTTWRWLLTWDIFSPFTLIICRILLGVAPAKTTRTWISSWVTYFCIYFFFCRTLFNHLSPAEFLSYKHANLRHHWEAQSFKRTCIIYSFFRDLFRSKQPQKGKRLTVFPTETFNNFNKVIVELRRPPQTRELRFVVLPYSSSLRILHFRLMKNGEAHKRWYG